MDTLHLKPEATPVACLSVPNTPSLMAGRRGSGVQMSAKLAALRGENDLSQQVRATSKGESKNIRFMQKNGRCNIKQEAAGTRERYLRDFFTTLVDMKWRNNLLFYIATYLIAWSLFGFLWWCIAFFRGDITSADDVVSSTTNQTRTNCVENVYSYTTAFLFFVETETSVGYGKRAITEECPEAIILFVIQALLGNVLDAFMIGCIFIKISQPKNRAETLVFSEKCVLSLRDKVYCLMFRVGNLRNSLMVQCRIRAKLVKARQTQEGEFLALHQDDINIGYDTGADNLFLVTPLIICHEITEKSPFYRLSEDDFKRNRFEIIVILEGMIESTGMICQARTSYTNEEVSWGERFAPVIDGGGKYYFVDHSTFNNSLQTEMPPASMYEFETDLKEKGPGSSFYKFVQERNIEKFRANLKNRQRPTRKVKSDDIAIDSKLSPGSIPIDDASIHNPSSTRRAVSEMNVTIMTEAPTPATTPVLNSETLLRRNNQSNRDDVNERRWSVSLNGNEARTHSALNETKVKLIDKSQNMC